MIEFWFSLVGTGYAVGTLIVAIMGISAFQQMRNRRRGPRPRDESRFKVLDSAMLVWGLTSLLYFWIAAGGPQFVRWLVYPFCAAEIFVTKLRLVGMFDTQDTEMAQGFGYYVVLFTVLPGVLAVFFAPAQPWWFIVSFVIAALLQVILVIMLAEAYPRAGSTKGNEVFWVSFVSLLLWAAYPVLYALSVYFGSISFVAENIGYLVADVVTKIFFESYAVAVTYGRN